MSTFDGEIARFNLLAGGVMDEREAQRLAGDPSARAFRAEPRPVAPELTGMTPSYLALLDTVEFTPEGAYFPIAATETEAA